LLHKGFQEECAVLLDKFRWGKSFLSVNEQVFEMYNTCKNSSDVVVAQQAYLEDLKKLKEEKGIDYEGTCS